MCCSSWISYLCTPGVILPLKECYEVGFRITVSQMRKLSLRKVKGQNVDNNNNVHPNVVHPSPALCPQLPLGCAAQVGEILNTCQCSISGKEYKSPWGCLRLQCAMRLPPSSSPSPAGPAQIILGPLYSISPSFNLFFFFFACAGVGHWDGGGEDHFHI